MVELKELSEVWTPALPELEGDLEWAPDYVRSEQGRKGDHRDADPFYVPQEDEFEGCRPAYTWSSCVCHEDCSSRAWGKVWKSSTSFMDSLDTMRAHLSISGKHDMTDEEIVQKLKDICEGGLLGDYMTVEVETPDDRSKYRK